MKKLLCILLSVLLVLPFAACGNSNDTAETGTGNGTDGAVTETETEAFFPDIEKKDYGEEFQMIGFHHPSMWYWVEGLTNEPLNDAIYEMSTRISDYLGEPTTPVLEENVGVNNYGFHVMPDDASSVLMTISGVYACDHLPGTPAPEKTTEAPTAAPTEAPTAAPTEAPTAAPTEAPTAAPTEAPTSAPTEAPTEVPTEAEKTGCKGVIGGSAALILTAVAAAVALKKR